MRLKTSRAARLMHQFPVIVAGRAWLVVGALLSGLAAQAHAQVPAPLAECGDLNGDNDKRIAACTRAIESGTLEKPVLLMAHVNRGRWLLQKGDSAGAIADFDKAIDIDPADPTYPLYYRGQANEAAGNKTQAIADYQRILTARPGEPNAVAALNKLGVAPPTSAQPKAAPSGGGGGGGGLFGGMF